MVILFYVIIMMKIISRNVSFIKIWDVHVLHTQKHIYVYTHLYIHMYIYSYYNAYFIYYFYQFIKYFRIQHIFEIRRQFVSDPLEKRKKIYC